MSVTAVGARLEAALFRLQGEGGATPHGMLV